MSETTTGGRVRWTGNPYGGALGDRDTMTAIVETPERIAAVVGGFTPARFEMSYAPGKWSTTRLLQHLAQCELVFAMRVRMSVTTDHYVVQPFDQDAWMAREPIVSGLEALRAYYEMRQFNLPLYRSLTPEERARPLTHPEHGPMIVQWILESLAGHELHHLWHFDSIAKG